MNKATKFMFLKILFNRLMLRFLLTIAVINLISTINTDAQQSVEKDLVSTRTSSPDNHEIFKSLIVEAETNLQSDSLMSKEIIDSAMHFNNQLDEELKFKNLTFLGRHYWQIGDMDSALSIFSRLKVNLADIKDKHAVANYYSNSGLLYYSIGDYQKSIKSHWSSIKLSTEIKDTVGIAKGYNNLGIVYLMMDEPEKALDYHTLSLQLCEQQNITRGIANCLGNIGIVYRKKNELDKAIEVYLRSLKINKEIGDRYNESLNYNNLGAVFEYKNEYKKALEYYNRSLEIRKELKDKSGIALALHNIGTIHRKNGDYPDSEKYYQEALSLATETHYKLITKETYKGLAELSELTGNLEKALVFRKKYESWKDSILNEENFKTIKNLEYRYETEKKENEILQLNHEKSLSEASIHRKNSLIKMMIISLILVIIIFILIVALFIQRSKTREKIFAKEKALDKMKENFFTGITHEFKTPLTLILDPVQSLISNESHPQKTKLLELIKNNGERLLNLVNELLTISKIEAGKQPLQFTQINLKDFLESILAVYYSIAKSKNMVFKVTQKNTDTEVKIDKQKIEKVLNNLLENAFKYTPSKGIISFIANVDDETLQFKIKDTGPGIPTEDQEKVFLKYYSGNTSQETLNQSFGIGLALAKEFVEMHNGNIAISSEQGVGTEFIVNIPKLSKLGLKHRIQDELEEIDNSDFEEFSEEKTDSKENPLVLIVEDNTELLQHVKKRLETSYKIRMSKNGEDGFKQAKKHIPDLILSDVIMPKMDGIELCKRIKTDKVTNHIPVIMLTAKSEVKDRMKGFATGADDYIPKPFQMDEVKILIDNLIQQRKKLREKYSSNLLNPVNNNPNLLSKDDAFLRKTNSIIETNILDDKFDVNILASELGTSRMQLHRKLKAITDSSTSEYIRNYRLHKAAELLQSKDDTIAEIAYEVGFNKPAYFSECFKKLYHITPQEFQRSVKEKTTDFLK